MLRRLFSLVYGFLGCWVIVLLGARFVFGLSPVELLSRAADGKDGFLMVGGLVASAWLTVHFALSKLPLIRRGWASVGGAVCAVSLLLYAVLLLGGAMLAA